MKKYGFVIVAALLVACGTPTEDTADVSPLVNSGKADGLGVTVLDGLDYGTDVQGEFESDLQFDAYEFLARENATITLDVTRRGSSSRVDTTMYIFGPKENGRYPDDAIVKDDDDGWGKLSRIDDFRLFREGVYMVVLGTKAGEGRGHYNLSMRCESGECAPQRGPDIDSCDDAVVDLVSSCMDWVFVESDYDLGDEPSNADLLRDCMTAPGSFAAEDWFDSEGAVAGICEVSGLCEDQYNPAQVYYAYICDQLDRDWCDQGVEAFTNEMMPACREFLTVPPLPTLNLTEIELSDSVMNPIFSALDDVCGEYCGLDIKVFSYEGDEVPMMKPLTLMMAFEYGQEFRAGTTYYDSSQESLLGLAANLEIGEEFTAAVESAGFDLGQDHPVGRAAWSGVPYPSVDVTVDGYTLLDEANKRLLFVGFYTASE